MGPEKRPRSTPFHGFAVVSTGCSEVPAGKRPRKLAFTVTSSTEMKNEMSSVENENDNHSSDDGSCPELIEDSDCAIEHADSHCHRHIQGVVDVHSYTTKDIDEEKERLLECCSGRHVASGFVHNELCPCSDRQDH